MLLHVVVGLLLAQGLPTTLAQEEPARKPQQEESANGFAGNINLWPILETRTLPEGLRRHSLWPLFHVTTMPQGGVHSWHVLNFLTGPNYSMFLPLYYSVDEHLGILPPLVLSGPDYFMAPPLLSGQCRYSDGDVATWVTPLFHVTNTEEGTIRSLHAGPYFQGENYWTVPPLLTWNRKYDSGESATWVTPMFHWTSDLDGGFVSAHVGPYLQGRNYWMLFPLAGSKTHDDESTSTWITPLFHMTRDKDGKVEDYHVGPYFEGKDWWSFPPLLLKGWDYGENGSEMTMGLFFWLKTDKEGLASTSLCPVFWWEREKNWFVLPLLSGQWDGLRTTMITPLFHVSKDEKDAVESFHVGPYFEGKDYWSVPPLLSWHHRDDRGGDSTWLLAPFFHLNHDKDGATSSHLAPVYFWERDDYWVAPPLLSMGWTSKNGDRTTWVTPFFHWTEDEDGLLSTMHLGPYMQGRDFWGIPPLLTGGWDRKGGGTTTWVTPLFHSTTDAKGDLDSLHVGPYFAGRNYWALPPLLSWHVNWPDETETTWLTPAFHLSVDAKGWRSGHVFPAFFFERDAYWVAPPLLTAGWTQSAGAQTTWVTPLFHVTENPNGDLNSLHVAPLWFWEREKYWVAPPLLSWGGTHRDGAQTTWVTPMFHYTEDVAGNAESFHAFPFLFWKSDDYWLVPSLLSGGFTRPDGSYRTWISPLYHDDYAKDGSLISRHALNYFEGPKYHHFVPVYWDWESKENIHYSMFAPPAFVRTEEPNGTVTTSLPWPFISVRTGRELDTSIGMEIRPFVYQEAGDQMEFNFLWRMFSILREEESTRVMVGPLWYSERPNVPDAMTSFQILGGLFARDCNYDTNRYRYRLLWLIPLGASNIPRS